MNIFEILNEKYYLPKKVRLFENFAGISCQKMGFERIKVDCDVIGITEVDKDAILSNAAMHTNFLEIINQYNFPNKQEMVDILQKKNIGYDFKKSKHEITMRMSDDKVKRYFLADKLLKNYGDISKVKGSDLPNIDVYTYSFPCQSLSKAGKQEGLQGGTRSGLVYEVLRILKEAKEFNNLPKVLIMENVVDLVQAKFIRQFQEIQKELEDLGYTNYTETLNAKDYGVAQNRDRVFMISILGDYYYEFPKPIKLEKRLKDYLEDEVDEKYYLSDKFIKGMLKEDTGLVDRKGQFMRSFQETIEERIASTITTRETNVATSNFILMPEKTNRGCVEAYDGDGVYINRPHQKRGIVQKGMIQTTKANNSDIGVVVYDDYNSSIRADQDTIGTLTTNCGSSAERNGYKLIEKENNNLVIRKLTPLEVWRLMGIDDEDFHKAQKSGVPSSQLYKQAGNGLVVDVFAAILKTMVKGEK